MGDSGGGEEVSTAFKQLTSSERERLVRFLNADGITVRPAFILYNAPNLLDNARKNQRIGMDSAIRMLLKIYDVVSDEYKESASPVITIMVDEIAAVASACDDPEVFALTDFEISRAPGVR